MSSIQEFLKHLPLFQGLEPEIIHSFSAKFIERSYKRNTLLYLNGDPLDRIFLVFQGRIKIHKTNPDGSKLFARYYYQGDLFPQFGFFRNTAYMAEALVDTDSTLLVMMREDFEGLVQMYPELNVRIIQMMGEHIQLLENQLGETVIYDSTERVILLLLRLAESHSLEKEDEKVVRLKERFTHRELAQMVGTTRETVSRVINRLKQEGYVFPVDGHMALRTDQLRKMVCSNY